MNIKITARYGNHWEGVVSHDAYGGLLEFTAKGATRPDPIRCPVSVFRSACELARALATAAARKAISELEVAALNGYTRLGKVYPLPGPDGDCRTIEEAAAPGRGRMPIAFRDGEYPAEGAATTTWCPDVKYEKR